jgi:hypothetical protein
MSDKVRRVASEREKRLEERRVNNATLVGEGLESMIGFRVLLCCPSFFYEGVLVGINAEVARLDDPHIVYDTGADPNAYADRSPTFAPFRYVRIDAIEAFELSRVK